MRYDGERYVTREDLARFEDRLSRRDGAGCAWVAVTLVACWLVIAMVAAAEYSAEAGAYNRAMETLGRDERITPYELAGCTGGTLEKVDPTCWNAPDGEGVEP